jgi:hypothetical protein
MPSDGTNFPAYRRNKEKVKQEINFVTIRAADGMYSGRWVPAFQRTYCLHFIFRANNP